MSTNCRLIATGRRTVARGTCVLGLLLALACPANARQGRIVDATTGAPLPFASVVVDERPDQADQHGVVPLPDGTRHLAARAPGYLRQGLVMPDDARDLTVRLKPFRPKALYLTPLGLAHAGLRGQALALAEQTEINALVIDVKGDRSVVPFRSQAYAQADIGDQHPIPVRDMPARMAELKARGLYLIARVVTFKDDVLATAHPQWAVRDRAGRIWRDREGLAWIDPFQQDAWSLSIGIAREAAALGFDEIQFDYTRFPDEAGLVFSEPNNQVNRVRTIQRFLDTARAALAMFNVFISVDVFGYVCWNENDTAIGQDITRLINSVDYVSPMLYPSGFMHGIPGHRQPVAAPYAIVHGSLQRVLQRTGVAAVRLRPWLQAFRDYAFDRRPFTGQEIRAQIDAAQALGTDGWMLWNPGNRYTEQGLQPRADSAPPLGAAPTGH